MTTLEASARTLARPVAFLWALVIMVRTVTANPRQLLVELAALFLVKPPAKAVEVLPLADEKPAAVRVEPELALDFHAAATPKRGSATPKGSTTRRRRSATVKP